MIKHLLLAAMFLLPVGLSAQNRAAVRQAGAQKKNAPMYFATGHGLQRVPQKSEQSPADLLGCKEGTVFGGEFTEDCYWSGFQMADQARPGMPATFFQHFSNCFYNFTGVRFTGMFNYYGVNEDWGYETFMYCDGRGGMQPDYELTKTERFEIAFWTEGEDGLPAECVYKQEFDILGEFTGVTMGDEVEGYGGLYTFAADLGKTIKMEHGFMSVTAVNVGEQECFFSIFTADTSVDYGLTRILMDGEWMWSGASPSCFCFKGDGSLAAEKGVKLDRILSSFENKSKYEKVQVEIFNYGKSDVSDIVLELWQDGKLISREYVGASLKSMESFKYTFTARADCSQTGEHEIVVRNVTPGDERLAPETITANVVNADMSSGEYGESSSHIFDNEQITKVQIGDFVNETEAATSGYSDFTAQKVDLRKGDELDVTVTCAGDYPNVGIWIDWNGNRSFGDEGEELEVIPEETDDAPHVFYAKLSIPEGADVKPGDCRMRIITSSYSRPYSPDAPYYKGETEDYTITVSRRPAEAAVSLDKENIDNTLDNDSRTDAITLTNSGGGNLQGTVNAYYVLPGAPTSNYSSKSQMPASGKDKAPAVRRMRAVNAAPVQADNANAQYVLRYDNGQWDAIGLGNYAEAVFANYFPGDMLSNISGMTISSVDVFIGDAAKTHSVVIYGQKDQNHAGEVITEQTFTPVEHAWNHVVLENPVTIGDKDLWIGAKMTGLTGDKYCIGIDKGAPVVGFGDLVNTGGDSWWSMADLGLRNNYCLRANVTGNRTPAISWLDVDKGNVSVASGGSEKVNVTMNAAGLPEGLYEANVEIQSNDPFNPFIKIPVYMVNGSVTNIVVNDAGKSEISLNNGCLTLKSAKDIATVQINDVSGRLIGVKRVNAKEAVIGLAGYGKAIYIVSVAYTDGSCYAVKVPMLK